MITEEMLCAAAARSCEIYVSYLERGYNPENQHEFSLQFKKKIKKLKRKADHPVFYHAARRIASIVLAILIAGGVWITVDAEARAAFVGWVKEIYGTYFVYHFEGSSDVNKELVDYRPTLLGIVFNGFCFINLIPHFFDYLMCPYYPAYTMGCYQIVIGGDNGG